MFPAVLPHKPTLTFPVLQLEVSVTMGSERNELVKDYFKMMTDMIVLCGTLSLSLFFWTLSLTVSTYYGKLPSASAHWDASRGLRTLKNVEPLIQCVDLTSPL